MALSIRQVQYATHLLLDKKRELLEKKHSELGLTPENRLLLTFAQKDRPIWAWFTEHYKGSFVLLRTKEFIEAIDDSSYYDRAEKTKALALADDAVFNEFAEWKTRNAELIEEISKKLEVFTEFEAKAEAELKRAETELHMGKDASVLETAMARLEKLFA